MTPALRSALTALVLLATPALAEDAPAPRPSFQLQGHELVLPSPITFKPGSATLTDASTPALEHLKAYLDAKAYISTLRIEGHAAEPRSQELTEQRALAVAHWLVARGVDCKRLVPVGFGNTKPVADNATPEGRAQNTRITAVNAGLRNRPIGGMPMDGGGKLAGDACAKAPPAK